MSKKLDSLKISAIIIFIATFFIAIYHLIFIYFDLEPNKNLDILKCNQIKKSCTQGFFLYNLKNSCDYDCEKLVSDNINQSKKVLVNYSLVIFAFYLTLIILYYFFYKFIFKMILIKTKKGSKFKDKR